MSVVVLDECWVPDRPAPVAIQKFMERFRGHDPLLVMSEPCVASDMPASVSPRAAQPDGRP